MAGAGGIEPTLTVLETVVLPLYDAPMVFHCAESLAGVTDKFKRRQLPDDGLGWILLATHSSSTPMKKLLFALAAVPLLAAGCAGSGSVATAPTAAPSSQTQQSMPEEMKMPNGTTMPESEMASSTVKVQNPDQAVQALIQASAAEQTKATSGDDTDLTASDTSDLNSYTNVTNGY